MHTIKSILLEGTACGKLIHSWWNLLLLPPSLPPDPPSLPPSLPASFSGSLVHFFRSVQQWVSSKHQHLTVSLTERLKWLVNWCPSFLPPFLPLLPSTHPPSFPPEWEGVPFFTPTSFMSFQACTPHCFVLFSPTRHSSSLAPLEWVVNSLL